MGMGISKLKRLQTSGFIILLVIALTNIGIWWLLNSYEHPPDWTGRVGGLTYNPFGADDKPQTYSQIREESVDRDMALIAGRTDRIRLYTALEGHERIPPIARKHGLSVTAGAWIDQRQERNRQEIDQLIVMANANPNVTHLLVGNETLLRKDMTTEELLKYVRQVKAATQQPVSVAEPWHVWMDNPELVEEVDFIAIHLLPYWEGISSNMAVNFVLDRYREITAMYPGKHVVITEVGWPSGGRVRDEAKATLATQAAFIRSFMAAAASENLDYYLIEAFDQPWKWSIEGQAGPYWGMWDANRNPKYLMTGTVMSLPEWPVCATSSTIAGIIFILMFLNCRHGLRLSGLLVYAVLLQAIATLLVYMLLEILRHYLTTGGVIAYTTLTLPLTILFIICLTEVYEICDIAWGNKKKRIAPPHDTDRKNITEPKVSIHIPTYNEPPAMLVDILTTLSRLDYENYEVLVIDNNTVDEAVWRPVEDCCHKLGSRFRFFHLDKLEGFKAGALNYAMTKTDPDTEIIAIVDSDYKVKRDWLRRLVPLFADRQIGFVQAPQDNRDWKDNCYKEMLNWEYAGFFETGMIQRDADNALIMHGTMSLIRREALGRVGKWAEWCICEDAEMGLRLIMDGWHGIYINERFGYGLIPERFSTYKTQRYRWAFGAVQIMRKYLASMISNKSSLTRAQRYQFIAGWLPWIGDAAGLVLAPVMVLWSFLLLIYPTSVPLPEICFLIPVGATFFIRLIRHLVSYRLRVPCTFRQSLLANLAGLSLSYSVGRAVLTALVSTDGVFVRTSKESRQQAWLKLAYTVQGEAVLTTGLLASAVIVWITLGQHDYMAKIWSLIMLLQALPYSAAVACAGLQAWTSNVKMADDQDSSVIEA